MKLKGQSHEVVVALAAAVELTAADLIMNADGTATQRIRLLPMGKFTTRGKGTYTVLNLAHAQQIVAASQAWAGQQDIPLDYDHQLVFAASGQGGTAPASGWIKPAALTAEADGVYGTVTWTAKAAAAINAGEYKYISPAIDHDAAGKVRLIFNAALTAYPATDGLTKLAASASLNNQLETEMDLTALAAILGLAATATLPEIEAAATAQVTALNAAQGNYTALTQALGLEASATHTAALSAATTLKAGGNAQTALMAQLQTQVTTLTAAANTAEVDAAITAGRIIPAQRDHYLNLLKTAPETARALMGSNPVVAGGEVLTGKPAGGATITALSAEQKQVCAAFGQSEADFLKALQESAT
ncbi:mu-like prophage FluMu I protein [Asticcacaulis biprosthecium C19]|uniref:Mu-like prophage FluMu I protein n=1 Tax=Asticcacaulis biprosthecium C19 TaxID=715226 RepID=F4QGA3_9CAUL|nr:phage protease [Asticcacaulis biprosthecium]EGF92431.1 mu-like prophage FluMu I protein [Asticcacaulis biprosthecium C19]